MSSVRHGIPPAAQLVIDFVNTVEWQVDDEAWSSPSALASWLHLRAGRARERLTDEHLSHARRVREGLREVLLLQAGHEPLGDAISELNVALARSPLHLRFSADGRPHLASERDSFLEPILAAVDTLRSEGDWPRVKACSRDSCRWAYWDSSRNRSGRWCSMQGCGNYIKMRRRNSPEASASDVIAPVDRPARMLDVAARAGVSIKTVSNVVTGAVRVSPATRARVEAAIAELDFHPNLAARALATGRRDSDTSAL
ncbi:LacI family DNA-binding transcriptional regulator [Microbacterium sp.]|uniref:CGNR zinc finger domain-containing protein n=1 Tax=Microbacterium sp. TaxID=51671 RepID=UPI002811556A|nr:LacI family DNA-binding transcriptional regulator [Microbacterium sp.]